MRGVVQNAAHASGLTGFCHIPPLGVDPVGVPTQANFGDTSYEENHAGPFFACADGDAVRGGFCCLPHLARLRRPA
ncbi:protein of unknown function [Agrobacterium pusense]|uniref:Uncharacterized protein n=1 Tax=Agrobacterium pusense TaxID=648995 RepID=U4Q3D5_9HYPH|nr:protein of unknown function [Agrobacterium pusense]